MRLRFVGATLSAQRGALVALALAALIAALAATAFPRFTAVVLQQDVRYRVAALDVGQRDLLVDVSGGVTADTTAALPFGLQLVRGRFGAALRSATRPGRFVARVDGTGLGGVGSGVAVAPVAAAPPGDLHLTLEADPRLRADAVLVSGSWPTAARPRSTIPVALSAAAASALHWRVGETRRLLLDRGARPVRLVGTVRPRRPADDFWTLDPTRAVLGTTPQVNDPPTLHAIGWAAPATFGEVSERLGGVSARAWYEVRADRVDAATAPRLRSELARALADLTELGNDPPQLLRVTSRLGDALDDAAVAAPPATALLGLVAAGPAGAAAAVLAAGVQAIAVRRAPARTLMRARGGSAPALAALAALEVAVAGVPGAVLGWVIAVVLVPGPSPDGTAAALVALLPPLGAAAGTLWPWGPRARVVGEALVLTLAIAAVVALLRTTGTAAGDPDPLFVLAPLLVALAAGLLLLRAQPVALRVLGRTVARGRGVLAFTGRAVCAAGTGAGWAVLAVVLAVAVAALSLVVLSTEAAGGAAAARRAVGADLVVTAPVLDDRAAGRIRAVTGVLAVAVLRSAGVAEVADTGSADVRILLTDAGTLADVQGDVPGSSRLPDWRTAGPVPALGQVGTASERLEVDLDGLRFPVRVTTATPPTDAIDDDRWLLVDQARVPAAVRRKAVPVVALVAERTGADEAAVRRALARAAPGADVDSATVRIAAFRGMPLIGGIEAAVLAALVVAAATCAVGVGVTLAVRGRARARLLQTLRALGFTPRQMAVVVAWELGPPTAAAILGGLLTGVALGLLLIGVLDLRPFTGGGAQPGAVIAPLPLTGLAVGFGIAAAAAVLVVVRRSARVVRAPRGED